MVAVALVATVVVVSTVRASLPKTSGSAELPGLAGDVTVMRDGSGIPHIFGDSLTDLARAQGYVHAQEQFFQMDLRRHITAGRLSELVTYGIEPSFLGTYVRGVMAVTAADVKRVADTYVRPGNAVVVVVGDRSQIEAGIRALNLGTVQVKDVGEFVK